MSSSKTILNSDTLEIQEYSLREWLDEMGATNCFSERELVLAVKELGYVVHKTFTCSFCGTQQYDFPGVCSLCQTSKGIN